MNKKTKIVSVILVVVLVIGLLINTFGAKYETKSARDTIKMGIALPLTGNVAFLGDPAQKAAIMALEEINSKNTKYNYKLVIEDDAFSPVRTASAVQKMINVDKVSAVVTFGSGTGNSANPIAETARVPHFALASDPTIANGAYNYIHWTPPFKQGKLMAEEIIKRGYKRVSLVDTNHPGPLAISTSIRQSLSGTNVVLVSDDLTNPGEKDFRTLAQKIKNANPEIVILEMFSPEIEIMTKQLRAFGVHVPVTSVEAIAWSGEIGLYEGQWFIADSYSREFIERYEKRWGVKPASGSQYIYDLVHFMTHIHETSDSKLVPSEIPAVITKINSWKSPVFGSIKVNSEGFFETEATVQIIRDGVPVIE